MKGTTAVAFVSACVLMAAAANQCAGARQIRSTTSPGALANGQASAGFHGGHWTGPNGGKWAGGAGGIVGKNAGLVGYGFKGTGPMGSTGQGAGIAGWKRGAGGFEGTQMSLKGAKGNTYNGYTRGKYNAQTGQGTYNASRQLYNAKTGKDSGWTNSTTYNKGQGVTQIDTDNRGDYTVDWGDGQKPTVTKDATGQ